jgi:hypothetical protein
MMFEVEQVLHQITLLSKGPFDFHDLQTLGHSNFL